MVVNKKEMEVTLLYIDIEQFKKEIYDDYCVIFPEEERKPLKLIEIACLRGYMKIIKIVHDKELVGFMILNKIKENGYAVLDYFAILPQYQGRGFGTISLKDLLEQEKDSAGIFIEIEKIGLGKDEAENHLREKRRQFYERLGFQKLDFDLVLFDVIYMPYVFSNFATKQDAVIQEVMEIYEAVAGKERIKENCKIVKNLKFEELSEKNLKMAAKLQYEIFPNSSAYLVYKSKITGERKSFYTSYITYFGDKPIGVIGLYEIPEYSDTVWLSWFGVKQEHRNKGFGKQMLDFICEIARKNNRKFLRLYTFEIWNSEAQKFYKKNMDLEEDYFNSQEQKDIFEGKPKIFSKSLGKEIVEKWNNKFINISEDENSHEESILMMKKDGIIK